MHKCRLFQAFRDILNHAENKEDREWQGVLNKPDSHPGIVVKQPGIPKAKANPTNGATHQSIRAEQHLQAREFSEKRHKLEGDIRAMESYKKEASQLRGEVQKLSEIKRELSGDVQILRKDLVKLQSDNKQIPGLRAEVEDMQKELMHAR